MKRWVSALLVFALLAVWMPAFCGQAAAEDSGSVQHDSYMQGSNDGLFYPTQSMTRAEFVQVLYNLYDYQGGQAAFSDVPEDAWYAPAVCALTSAGLIKGYEDGTFRPEQPITRAELVSFLVRAYEDSSSDNEQEPAETLEEPGLPTDATDSTEEPETEQSPFPDVEEEHWAKAAIVFGWEKGWIYGDPDGAFRPDDELIRAEAVTAINRFLNRYPDTQAITPKLRFFPDVLPESWYYGQVMEATVPHTAHCQENGETWVDATACKTVLPDGFQCIRGNLYVVVDGFFVTTAGTGTYLGMNYVCEGSSGICRVSATTLVLANGKRILISNGVPDLKSGLRDTSEGLYYVQPGGVLLTDGSYNTLYFGGDGRYTSGNAAIDAYVDTIVRSQTTGTMTQTEKFRACYEYVFYHVSYRSNNNHVPRGADASLWTEEYMLRLIDQGKGNCYCYASEMYYIARRLGYWQAKAISGGVGTNNTDHGWVEISVNGVKYITDPELESKWYKTPGQLFMKRYSETPWPYYPA